MKYRIAFVLFAALIIGSCNTNNQKSESLKSISNQENKIEFEWVGFEYNGKKYKYGGMLTPAYLDTINRAFKMQFDLGSNVSMIYANPLDTIMSKYHYLKDKVISGDEYKSLNIKTKIDSYTLSFDSIAIAEDYGDKAKYDDLSLIGTIGADVIEEKILIIDFENTTLEILEDSTYLDKSKFSFVPLEFLYGKIFIPLTINGKTYQFFYDTGASLTAITTIDNDFFNEVSKQSAPADTMKLNSWGNSVAMIKKEINVPIEIGDLSVKVKNQSVFYTEDQNLVNTFEQVSAKGLIGNVFFKEKKIAIDLINNQFGISKE